MFIISAFLTKNDLRYLAEELTIEVINSQILPSVIHLLHSVMIIFLQYASSHHFTYKGTVEAMKTFLNYFNVSAFKSIFIPLSEL